MHETDLTFEGYPGPLQAVLGIRVEEIDALYPEQHNQIVMADGTGSYSCAKLCDIVHAEGARVLATYGDDFYAGTPVVTENSFGQGQAYYIATDAEASFLDDFYGRLLEQQGITPLLETSAGVEVTLRETDQRRLLFVLNHNAEPTQVRLPEEQRFRDHLGAEPIESMLELPPYGVSILEVQE